jgi:3-oxoacyl-[acyl-carrier-protein] synthase II
MALFETEHPQRVVITGIGMVTNLGLNSQTTWQNLLDGQSGIRPLSFEHADVKFGGEVQGFDPKVALHGLVDPKKLREIPFAGYYSIKASHEAMLEANVIDENTKFHPSINPEEFGVFIGTGIGGAYEEDPDNPARVKRPSDSGSTAILHVLPERVATSVGMAFGLGGSTITPVAACASGQEAIGLAAERIASSRHPERIMLAGGSETPVSPRVVDYFNRLGALSRSTTEDTLSLPFDSQRNGFYLSEGSVVYVLEDLDHALERNVEPIVEIVGYGSASDGGSVVTATTGKGMRRSVKQARRFVQDLSEYGKVIVGAHATATKLGDFQEAEIIKEELSDCDVLTIASKGWVGHSAGNAGPMTSAVVIRAQQEEKLPPNKYNELEEGIELNLPKQQHEVKARYGVSIASGFGGLNATLIFERIFV